MARTEIESDKTIGDWQDFVSAIEESGFSKESSDVVDGIPFKVFFEDDIKFIQGSLDSRMFFKEFISKELDVSLDASSKGVIAIKEALSSGNIYDLNLAFDHHCVGVVNPFLMLSLINRSLEMIEGIEPKDEFESELALEVIDKIKYSVGYFSFFINVIKNPIYKVTLK